ncbi:MAG: hypothetical protein VX589_12495 [Myxococcota bacterium]|nr:hypothetical protein [Myxococcota bacterium]
MNVCLHRWLGLVLLTTQWACSPTSPQDDYNDFQQRTAEVRASACLEGAPTQGIRGNLTARDGWLLRALLSGGITLGLRVAFAPHAEGATDDGERYEVRIWLDDQDPTSTPLVTTETTIGVEGTFRMSATPLKLPPELLGSETSVFAEVILDAAQVEEGLLCGIAFGSVVSPLELNLEGSTFAAQPFVEGIELSSVPFACPGACLVEPAPDADGTEADADVSKPTTPIVDVAPAKRQDLTGEWLMSATLGVLPLNLWVTLNYREAPDGILASLDGAIRLTTDPVDGPARATFTAPVDPEGRFEVWLPDFRLNVNEIAVEADILLAAASTEEGWCGLAAGEVRAPIELDLEGSTFRAQRWVPGSEPPEDLQTRCP